MLSLLGLFPHTGPLTAWRGWTGPPSVSLSLSLLLYLCFSLSLVSVSYYLFLSLCLLVILRGTTEIGG